MSATTGKRMFPCPVCTDPREVRITKKDKPYIICDPCGIQVFRSGPAGIAAFNRLVEWARTKTSGPGSTKWNGATAEMPRVWMPLLD